MSINRTSVIDKLPKNAMFTKEFFTTIVRDIYPSYSDSAVTWLLFSLKKEQQIESIGRGKYVFVIDGNKKPVYSYKHQDKYLEIEQCVKDAFPLTDFQMWEMYQMNEFVNHLFGKNTIFVEVESPLEAAVFERLHGEYPDVLFCPDVKMYYRQMGNDNTIVVQKLLSEAPRPVEGHTCPLEKLLVDIFSSKLSGKIISRGDYAGLYENAFSAYAIDETKMFRYARRRNLEEKIKRFISEETSIRLNGGN